MCDKDHHGISPAVMADVTATAYNLVVLGAGRNNDSIPAEAAALSDLFRLVAGEACMGADTAVHIAGLQAIAGHLARRFGQSAGPTDQAVMQVQNDALAMHLIEKRPEQWAGYPSHPASPGIPDSEKGFDPYAGTVYGSLEVSPP